MRFVIYFLIGLGCMVIQTSVFPRLLPITLKPDLLLILVVYIGVNETYGRGGLIAYFLGLLTDVFAGSYMGMYGMTFLVLFFIIRGAVSFFNSENPLLLLFMVLCGTVVETVLLVLLGFMADAGDLWLIVLRWVLPQILINVVAGYLALVFMTRLQRRFPLLVIPGLSRLDSDYEG